MIEIKQGGSTSSGFFGFSSSYIKFCCFGKNLSGKKMEMYGKINIFKPKLASKLIDLEGSLYSQFNSCQL